MTAGQPSKSTVSSQKTTQTVLSPRALFMPFKKSYARPAARKQLIQIQCLSFSIPILRAAQGLTAALSPASSALPFIKTSGPAQPTQKLGCNRACLPRPLASLHRLQRPARILSQCKLCLGEGLKIVHKMQSPQHDYAPVNQTLNVIQPPLCQPARELPETVRVFRLLCSESVRNPA